MVQELLSFASSAAELSKIATDLKISARVTPPSIARVNADSAERAWLLGEGFAGLRAAGDAAVCAALTRAVEALRARELPATFVYAFDEPWAIGVRIRDRISQLVRREYRLVEDVWAWHIPPGSDGWPPHRGVSHVALDRNAPEVINVWVALSEVTPDRSCMHAIPLGDDPGYPDALDRLDAPLSAVRALPARAGNALFWNANVLHWGGHCARRAVGPRVSCSFTLCRDDAAERFPELVLLGPLEQLDLARRMDALARMVRVYGTGQSDVSPHVAEWASVVHDLARFARERERQRKAP
ncbi:MAG: hypothetical protein JWP87_5562 [Labilithrix sp.]|nr:hypothetical protein [Labilithrix sp.]